MDAVWERSQARGDAMVTLLALAYLANDEGQCRVSLQGLSTLTRQPDGRLLASVRELHESRQIELIDVADEPSGRWVACRVLGAS